MKKDSYELGGVTALSTLSLTVANFLGEATVLASFVLICMNILLVYKRIGREDKQKDKTNDNNSD